MTEQELIEALSDKEHDSWARWQQYLFSKCDDWYETDVHGQEIYSGKIIPLELVERWQRQIETPYAELSEQEKQSDRDEVAHILPIIREYIAGQADQPLNLLDQAAIARSIAVLDEKVSRLQTEVFYSRIISYSGKPDELAEERQTLRGRVNELSAMAALGEIKEPLRNE